MNKMLSLPFTLLIFSVALFTAACSESSKGIPYAVEISEEGVGRIKADTPFNAAQITTLMPGFKVTPYTSFISGNAHPVLHLSRAGRPVMTVMPAVGSTRIESIAVHSPEIAVSNGARIGDRFDAIFQRNDTCLMSEEGVLCRAPGSHHVHYLFTTPKIPDGNIPTYETLQHASVHTIIWKSDA